MHLIDCQLKNVGTLRILINSITAAGAVAFSPYLLGAFFVYNPNRQRNGTTTRTLWLWLSIP